MYVWQHGVVLWKDRLRYCNRWCGSWGRGAWWIGWDGWGGWVVCTDSFLVWHSFRGGKSVGIT